MSIAIYKAIQLLLLLVFAASISDLRRKPGMAALIAPGVTAALKTAYALGIIAYGWVLIGLSNLGAWDWAALFPQAVGTSLVVKAKRDLGGRHSWAGYYIAGATRIDHGIYRFVDHPMYVGIALMMVGAFVVLLPRLAVWQTAIAVFFIVGVIVYLAVVARRERRILDRTNIDSGDLG